MSELAIDLDALTITDVADLEDATGMAFFDIAEALQNKPRPDGSRHPIGKALQGLAWLAQRATNPDLAFADTEPVRFTDLTNTSTAVSSQDADRLPPPDAQNCATPD